MLGISVLCVSVVTVISLEKSDTIVYHVSVLKMLLDWKNLSTLINTKVRFSTCLMNSVIVYCGCLFVL